MAIANLHLLAPAVILALFNHSSVVARPFEGTGPVQNSDVIETDFAGEIRYVGQQNAEVTKPARAPRINNRNLIGSIIGAATAVGATEKFGGGFTVTVVYQGESIKGTYSGTGGMMPGSFTGTRDGDICTAYNNSDGWFWQGRCDMRTYSGTFVTPKGVTPRVKGSFDARASQFVDYVVRDRQRAEADAARKRAAALAEVERKRTAPAPKPAVQAAAVPAPSRIKTPQKSPAISGKGNKSCISITDATRSGRTTIGPRADNGTWLPGTTRTDYTSVRTQFGYGCGPKAGFTHILVWFKPGVMTAGRCNAVEVTTEEDGIMKANFVFEPKGHDNLSSISVLERSDCIHSIHRWEYNNDGSLRTH